MESRRTIEEVCNEALKVCEAGRLIMPEDIEGYFLEILSLLTSQESDDLK